MTKRILDVTGTNEMGVKQPVVHDIKLWNRAMVDIAKNNTWCPDIVRIIFNVGERKVNGGVQPTLATTVFFSDNTKVTCLNSEHDKITLVEDPKTGAMTASDVDKERGIIYCTVKKLISSVEPKVKKDKAGKDVLDENGNPVYEYDEFGNLAYEMKTEGFGRILRELVASGWDQRIEDKKIADRKAAAKARAKELANLPAKPKRQNASLYETVNRLADVVEKLEAKVDSKSTSAPKKVSLKKSARKVAHKVQKRNAKGQFV